MTSSVRSRRTWLAIAGCLLLLPTFGPAQAQTPSSSGAVLPAPEPGMVVLFNRPLTVFRAPLFGRSPTERAKVVESRLRDLVNRKPSHQIGIRRSAEGVLITIDSLPAFVITPGDVDPDTGDTIEETAEGVVQRLHAALAAAEVQGSWRFLLRATALSLGATSLLALVVWGVHRLKRWLLPRLVAAAERRERRMSESGVAVLGSLVRGSSVLAKMITWCVLALATYTWLVFCLRLFPYTEPWGERLGSHVVSTLSSFARLAVNEFPDLFIVAVIAVATRLLVGVVCTFFAGIQSGRIQLAWLDADAAKPTSQLVVIVTWLFALVMAYPYLPGSNTAAFKAVGVFVGVLLSLGATGVVGQFTGGLVLMYSRGLKAGEYVRIGEHEGTVLQVGFLSTKLRTANREEVYIPNSVVLSTTVTNLTRLAADEGVLLHTTVTIGYDTPWRQVESILLEAARRTPGLRSDPPAFVRQTSLSDFHVAYQLKAPLEQPSARIATLSALHANIQDVFNEHGVQIMSPHYLFPPTDKVWVPPERWHGVSAERPAPGSGARGRTGPELRTNPSPGDRSR